MLTDSHLGVACVHVRRYDFGYLLKILTCMPLPVSETEFFELLNLYFPNIFDIKYMMKFCDNLHGGLNKLAEMLDVQRIGPQHQAGSDRCVAAGPPLVQAGGMWQLVLCWTRTRAATVPVTGGKESNTA